jgi:hypothetical protein
MKRQDLEHIIRAAGAIAGVTELIIVGSQSILGKFPRPGNAVLTASLEADIYPPQYPELAEVIDGSIGRDSSFHTTFGYYADGVGPETATLPAGWQGRLIEIKNENTNGVSGLCLEPHDLAASKLAAGREKDIDFVDALIAGGYIEFSTLRERVQSLPVEPQTSTVISGRVAYLETKYARKVSRDRGVEFGM